MSRNENTEARTMKVVLTGIMCGPNGNAYRGTVLDVPESEAKEMIKDNQARAYDPERDAKAPRGLVRAER